MPKALIVYATTYGQTEKIAGYMAGRLRAHGCDVEALHVDAAQPLHALADYDAVLLGGSLYMSRYQRGLSHFMQANRAALNRHSNTLFFSVSASAARADGRQAVQPIISAYLSANGWQPRLTAQLAGAVKYPRYRLPTRWIMRRISRKEGGGIDTHREYEYTDWDEVDVLLDQALHR